MIHVYMQAGNDFFIRPPLRDTDLIIHLKLNAMKRGINKVTLVGHVGEDPKINQINDDVKVARFPLATNEFYVDKEGNEVQKTQWHTIVVWNKVAGIIEEYVKKGDPLYVEGKIQNSTWEDNEGKKRFTTEINCDNFLFLAPQNQPVEE
jgi:single-strand DNA-binding protein